MSKYKNKKIEVDGIIFDSKKEAKRYEELKLMQECGSISNLELQKKFDLIPAQYREVNGKKKCIERQCRYISDFYYHDNITKEWVCEDVKGMKQRRPEYIIKRKLMLWIYDIRIKEI